MDFSGERAKKIAEEISIPRLTGSSGEHKVIDIIIDFLKANGYSPEVDKFRFSITPAEVVLKIIQILIGGTSALSLILFNNFPILSVLISVVIAGTIVLLTGWSRLTEIFYDFKFLTRESHNIFARNFLQDGLPDVIFMAHYDSKSQTFSIKFRIFLNIVGITAVLFSIISIIFCYFSGMKIPGVLIYIIAVLSILPFLILIFNFTGNSSPGAVDNASGVAVVLELARILKEWKGKANLYFLLTGAEESGLAGAVKFIQKYENKFKKGNTFFVNYDGISNEFTPVITVKYGLLATRTSRKLEYALTEIFRKRGMNPRSTWLLIGAGLDSIPVSSRGFDSITISCGSLQTMKTIHSVFDSVKNLSDQTLKLIGDSSLELLEYIIKDNGI